MKEYNNLIGRKEEQYKRELDAALKQLKEVDRYDPCCCGHCKHDNTCRNTDGAWFGACNYCTEDCPCRTCEDMSNWEWCGPDGGNDANE